MDSIDRAVIDKKVKGWGWVASEFARVAANLRAEADRLLGPDRGE